MLWNSVNNYFKNKFGEKVHRIAVDAGFTCPNRDGTKGIDGCCYCDEEGSRAAYVNPEISITEQIAKGIEHIHRRYKAKKFIVYFQPYTNTYASVEKLEKFYLEAINADNRIVGIAIGTRTDCITDDILNLLKDISKQKFLWVEYGLQSIRQDILDSINRCDTISNFKKIVQKTNALDINIVAHIIFGLPFEKSEDAKETAIFLNNLKIWGVKIHSLYLTKYSQFGKIYMDKPFDLISLSEYIYRTIDFLEYLNPEITIHRLASDVSQNKLIAPNWIKDKQKVIKGIEEELKKRNSYQGAKFIPKQD